MEKLIRLEQFKISQVKLRVSKVQDGWEKGFYTPEESQTKLAEHRDAVARSEAELLRQELNALRNRNLEESTFQERVDLVAKLGIKILPSEDLRTRKIYCRLNIAKLNEKREQSGFTKVTLGGEGGI